MAPDNHEADLAQDESSGYVLRINSTFNRVSPLLELGLFKPQRLTRCDPELGLDEVHTSDHLGDGVLDL